MKMEILTSLIGYKYLSLKSRLAGEPKYWGIFPCTIQFHSNKHLL